MARSQLLKDAVNGKASLENIFFRLKVILSDLESDSIKKWIDGEIEGYKPDEELPSYRIIKGVITGTYLVNYEYQYENQPVPLTLLINDEERERKLHTMLFRDGIGTIQNFIESEKDTHYRKVFPPEFCSSISTEEIQIASMKITAPSNAMTGLLAQVKAKLVDVIMELEKEFDNLDDLDIRTQVQDNDSVVQTVTHIEKIIFGSPIEIGDNNKFTRSGIGNIGEKLKDEY